MSGREPSPAAERAENIAEFNGLVRRIGSGLGAGLFCYALGLMALRIAEASHQGARREVIALGLGAALFVMFRGERGRG